MENYKNIRIVLTLVAVHFLFSPIRVAAKDLSELLPGQIANLPPGLAADNDKAAFILGQDLALLAAEYNVFVLGPAIGGFVSSNAAVNLQGDLVLIDAVANGDTESLEAALVSVGLQNASRYQRMVSGYLPITAIARLPGISDLNFARPSYVAAGSGNVTSQGDESMLTELVRPQFGVSGAGITVGTLSDSYDFLSGAAGDVLSDDLPSGITVIEDLTGSGIDEGRAMMQIVHDVAPGSTQGFHTAFLGQADFAQGIEELAGCPPGSSAGCTPVAGFFADVINDDVFYFAEPFFQDGVIAQAVDHVVDSGVAYFALAGNHARKSYEEFYSQSGQFDPEFGGELHDFDGLGDVFQSITVPVNRRVVISFQWDEPFASVSGPPGAQSDYDIFVFDDMGGDILAQSADSNIGGDPVEILSFTNDGSVDVDGTPGPDTEFNIALSLFDGFPSGLLKYIALVNGGLGNFVINEFDTQSSTIYGHMNAQHAITVGAAPYFNTPIFGQSPPLREPFTSAGGLFLLYDIDGNFGGRFHEKPDIIAPDGGNNTFFGFDSEPDGWPNFFGTSAATPHAAAVGALVLETAPSLSPFGMKQVMSAAAAEFDMNLPGFDFDTGYGFLETTNLFSSVADAASWDGDCGIAGYILSGVPNIGPQTFRASGGIGWEAGTYALVNGQAPVHGFRNGFIGANGSSWGDCLEEPA